MLVFWVIMAKAQSEIKDNGCLSIQLLTGYVTIPETDDLSAKLTANNFGPIGKHQFDLGFAFSLVWKRNIVKLQAEVGWHLASHSSRKVSMTTHGMLINYGYDLLPKSVRTFAYPFFGLKILEYSVSGKSYLGDDLNADKSKYGFATGFGLLHFFTPPVMQSYLNQIDLNVGVNIAMTSGKWKHEGAEFVAGTLHKNFNYFLTLSLGYGTPRKKN